MNNDKLDYLINVLLDTNLSTSERDDAAIDLAEFNDTRALNALTKISTNFNEEKSILDVCGESIAEIWDKQNKFNLDIYKKLHPLAQLGVRTYINANRHEWAKIFGLD